MRQKTVPWTPLGLLLCGIMIAQPVSAEEQLNSAAPFAAPAMLMLVDDDDDDDDDGYRRRWRRPYADGKWGVPDNRRGYVIRGWGDDDDDDRRYPRRWRWRRRHDDDDDDDD